MTKKQSASMVLCHQNLAENIEQASRLIMAGLVFIDMGTHVNRVAKPGDQLAVDAPLFIQGKEKSLISIPAIIFILLTRTDVFFAESV